MDENTLSEGSKRQIQREENYRAEVRSRAYRRERHDITYWFNIVQIIAVVIGIFVSVGAYIHKNRDETRQANLEFSKYFYERQFEIYEEAAETASIMALSLPGSDTFINAHTKFSQLFWGKMALVEDKCVEGKMVLFRMMINQYTIGDTITEIHFVDACTDSVFNYRKITPTDLKNAALRLAHQCRLTATDIWLPLAERKNYNHEE